MTQLTLPTKAEAEARRDDGMRRVEAHAERDRDGWRDDALAQLRAFLTTTHGSTFLTEQVREYAARHGMDAPPDDRAWGPLMKRAERDGLIAAAGYAPANSSNRSPKVLWRGMFA